MSENLSLMDELKSFVMEEEAKALGLDEINEDYRILSVDQANFFLKRFEDLKDEEEEINSMCDKEIEGFTARVNAFRDNKLHSNINAQNYCKKILERYAETELIGSKKKSIKLPFGTLQFRKGSVQYTYEDEKLLEFLNKNKMDSLITTKQVPNKADFKKVVDIKDGKAYINDIEIPGVTVSEGNTNFDVKLNK